MFSYLVDPSDYDKIDPTDRISIIGLKELAPGSSITLRGKRKDGSTYDIPAQHTFNENQVGLGVWEGVGWGGGWL